MFDILSIHWESLAGLDGLLAEEPEGVQGGGEPAGLGQDDRAVEQGHRQHRALATRPGMRAS